VDNNQLSSKDVSTLIDHLLKSKDPATVGVRKILKSKRDAADDFPLHPLSYEEFHVPGKTKDPFSHDEKLILELEKKVKDLELRNEAEKKNAKAAIAGSYQQGVKEGLAKGEEEGKKKSRAVFDTQVSDLQSRISKYLEDLESAKNRIYFDAHTVLLKLCLELTKKIIHTECMTNPDIVCDVIKKSLKYISDREKLIVRVAKNDLELVSLKKDFWLPIGEKIEKITIESDDRVEKGGCIIDSNSGTADARLGIQLTELTSLVESIWESSISSLNAAKS